MEEVQNVFQAAEWHEQSTERVQQEAHERHECKSRQKQALHMLQDIERARKGLKQEDSERARDLQQLLGPLNTTATLPSAGNTNHTRGHNGRHLQFPVVLQAMKIYCNRSNKHLKDHSQMSDDTLYNWSPCSCRA